MSQNDQIAKHLKKRGTINPLEALHLYGCFRLAARIYDLRSKGMIITTEEASEGFAVYRWKP